MIRKVFCFRGIVYSESDCPSPDPAPFVPVPGRGRELRTMRWIPSLCVQQFSMLHTFDHSESCSPASNDTFRFFAGSPRFPGRTKHPSVPVSPLRPLPPAEIQTRCQIGPERWNRSVSDVRRTSGFLTLPGRLRRGCDNTLPG